MNRQLQGSGFLRRHGRSFNVLFRVPLALPGLVCLVAGVAIIGWVFYYVFIERQKEYSVPGLVIGLGRFGVGLPLVLYGWFTSRSVLRRKEEVRLSPEEQQEFEHEEDDEEPVAPSNRRQTLADGHSASGTGSAPRPIERISTAPSIPKVIV